MDKVARQAATDRAVLFNQTGAARGLANAIIEKDFWVCWTLKRLFDLQEQEGTAGLVFKGDTSLSKAYGAIRRFSEDIDLSFDRADLGYDGDRNPETASKKRAKKLIENLVADVQQYIATVLLLRLKEAVSQELGDPGKGGWNLAVDGDDLQSLNFYYPSSLDRTDYAGLAYIHPRVKLEFGARGDPWPTEKREIRPYAAEEFPNYFESPACTVDVLALRRTFWEKATALHAEHHRATGSPTPRHFSRHYYDLALLADGKDGQAAIRDVDLLMKVAAYKSVFFRSAWAHYESARPGTLRLTPKPERLADLRADYRQMAPMMFDDPAPSFDEIMNRIEALERLINQIEV